MSLFARQQELSPLEIAALDHVRELFAPKTARYSATTIGWVAKALKEGEGCLRWFWWPYVVGIDSPPSKAQAFGTRGHSHVEKYLKFGTLPELRSREGVVATSGLRHLPQPGTPGLKVEEQFQFETSLGKGEVVTITGTKDFYVAPLRDPRRALVGDHKFIKHLKYAMSKLQLENDVQSNLYSYDTIRKFPQIDWVDNLWVYYQKEGERIALPVRVERPVPKVREYFDGTIKPALRYMKAMVDERPRLSDVPPNEDMCSAFGGCAHRARCEVYKSRMKMGVVSAAVKSQPAKAAPPPSAPAQKAPITKSSIVQKAEAIKKKYEATDVNPPAPDPVEPETTEEPGLDQESRAVLDTMAETQAEEVKAVKAKGKKTVAKAAAEVQQAFAPPAAETPRGTSRTAPGYNAAHNYWLLFGCIATKGAPAALDVDQITGPAQAALAQANGVAHYRKIGYAALEAGFAEWMEQNAITGVVRVPANLSPAARDVVGLLRAHAALVIEGDAQ